MITDPLDVASVAAITGDRDHAAQLLANLEDRADQDAAVARALLAGVVGDRDALEQVAVSTFPLVRAAAQAELAELDSTRDVAAYGWQRVLDLDRSGRTRTAALVHLARARESLGDLAGAARLCAAAKQPMLPQGVWTAAVVACAALDTAR